MDIREITAVEVEQIEAATRAYRALWATLRGAYVPPCTFNGDSADIDALDWIDYEAGFHPLGLQGAAIIWGRVLVATGALQWAVGNEQHLILTSTCVYPRVMIFPYGRVVEIQNSSTPQYGKFEWILQEAVLRLCAHDFDEEQAKKLRSLVTIEYGCFFECSQDWMNSTYPASERRGKPT